MNRAADLEQLLADDPRPMIDGLLAQDALSFTLSLLTNRDADTLEIVMRRRGPDQDAAEETAIGLTWPKSVFSLSHVALPFPESDPLYGNALRPDSPTIELGVLALRGERGVLRISPNDMLRLRWNPFFGFMEERVLGFVEAQRKKGG